MPDITKNKSTTLIACKWNILSTEQLYTSCSILWRAQWWILQIEVNQPQLKLTNFLMAFIPDIVHHHSNIIMNRGNSHSLIMQFCNTGLYIKTISQVGSVTTPIILDSFLVIICSLYETFLSFFLVHCDFFYLFVFWGFFWYWCVSITEFARMWESCLVPLALSAHSLH